MGLVIQAVAALRNLALHSQRSAFSSETSLTASKTLLLPERQHREKKTTEEEREIEATLICKQRPLLERLAAFQSKLDGILAFGRSPVKRGSAPGDEEQLTL